MNIGEKLLEMPVNFVDAETIFIEFNLCPEMELSYLMKNAKQLVELNNEVYINNVSHENEIKILRNALSKSIECIK